MRYLRSLLIFVFLFLPLKEAFAAVYCSSVYPVYKTSFTAHNASELKVFVEERARLAFPDFRPADLTVEAPNTRPRSGAEVFIVKHMKEPIAVYKIFNNQLEVTREIESNRILRSLPELDGKPPEIFRLEKVNYLGLERPAALMEYIPTSDMESSLKLMGTQLRQIDPKNPESDHLAQRLQKPFAMSLQLVALTLAQLHVNSGVSKAPIDASIKDYDIGRVQRFFNPESLNKAVRESIFTRSEADRLLVISGDVAAAYRADQKIPGALIHGDAHPGNIVATPGGRIRLIDTETLMWSARLENGQVYGIGDPLSDVGRFLSVFVFRAKAAGFHPSEIFALSSSFLEVYWSRTGFNFESIEASLNFHLLRFAALVLEKGETPDSTVEIKKSIADILRSKFPL